MLQAPDACEWSQVPEGSTHVSTEHTLPSLQSIGVLVQLPLPLHASGEVQPRPSLQGAPDGATLAAQDPAPSQESA